MSSTIVDVASTAEIAHVKVVLPHDVKPDGDDLGKIACYSQLRSRCCFVSSMCGIKPTNQSIHHLANRQSGTQGSKRPHSSQHRCSDQLAFSRSRLRYQAGSSQSHQHPALHAKVSIRQCVKGLFGRLQGMDWKLTHRVSLSVCLCLSLFFFFFFFFSSPCV